MMSYDVLSASAVPSVGCQGASTPSASRRCSTARRCRYVPNALTRYRKETVRLIAEMTMGTGALVMIGGTVGVAAFLTLASGGVIVQGYSSLQHRHRGADRASSRRS